MSTPHPAGPSDAGPDRSRPPAAGPLRPFRFPDVHRQTLGNGMQVLVAEIAELPVVTLSLLLRAGGAQEPAERAGLATLVADALDSGTGSRTAAQIAEQMETLGVQLGSSASWDSAQIGITGLRSRIEPATELLGDILAAPTFPADEIARLRQEQVASIAQRRAEPRGLANEMAARFIYSPASTYARPLGGTPDTVGALTREDVASFFAEQYAARSATLVVAGALSPEEATALVERCFGSWQGGAGVAARAVAQPASDKGEIVVVHRPGAVQSEIRTGHVGVPRDTPDYFPLIVMNTILGGAFSSRLNLNLREKHGYTYGVSSGFSMRRQAGPFLVSTAVQTEVTAAAVAEILAEILAIRDDPVRPAELDDAGSYVAGVLPLRLQTTDGVAARLAESAVYDLPPDYLQRYRDHVLAVGADDVLRVAQTHLHPDRAKVVIVGDADRIRTSLEQLGVGAVRVVGSDGEPL